MIEQDTSTHINHSNIFATPSCLPDMETRTQDLVTLYIREVKAFKLLDSEEEVRLAKKIEQSKNEILSTVAAYPAALDSLFEAFKAVDKGSRKIHTLIYGFRNFSPMKKDEFSESPDFSPQEIKTRLHVLLQSKLKTEQLLLSIQNRADPVVINALQYLALNLAGFKWTPEVFALLSSALKSESKQKSEIGIDALNKQLCRAETALTETKAQMIKGNLRLVLAIARSYREKGLAFSDLIQSGNLGLIKAVDRFEYRFGCRFSTYATGWIRQSIRQAVHEQRRTIRLPKSEIQAIHHLKRTERQILSEKGLKATNQELADHLGVSVSKVHRLQQMKQDTVSLEKTVESETDFCIADSLSNQNIPSPLESAMTLCREKTVQALLGHLKPRESLILKMRFGLNGDRDAKTLKEISADLGVSRQCINQIETRALNKLRRVIEKNLTF